MQGRGAASASAESLLAGHRMFALVPASAPGSALGLGDDGRLVVADDDRGRRTFVLVPQAGGSYLVRAAEPGAGGAGTCWQVESRGSDPLTVVAAACAPGKPDQLFSVMRQKREGGGPDTYAISNLDAYLQLSATRGPILEELGDAPLSTTFRFEDAGPAPR